MTRRLVLPATGLLMASLATSVGLAAPPSDSIRYAVQARIEQTVAVSRNASGAPEPGPCGTAAIRMKLNASGKFYVSQPRNSSSDYPLVATNVAFRGALQGRHPSLPLTGQLSISTDLQEATAEECLGQLFPAERCERKLAVRRMEFHPTFGYWGIDVKPPPRTNNRCLDYVTLIEGRDGSLVSIAATSRTRMETKLLRGKNFTWSGHDVRSAGRGTERFTWTFNFVRIR